MDKFLDSLEHCSEEGRREVLDDIFRAIADKHVELERQLAEQRENFDRVIWLRSIGSDSEAAVELYKDILEDTKKEITHFMSFLWDLNAHYPDWLQKYRDEKDWRERGSEIIEAARPEAPAHARPKKRGGRPPKKRREIMERMQADIERGVRTPEQLENMPPKMLKSAYRAHHGVLKAAREQVLQQVQRKLGAEFPSAKIRNNSA